MRNKLYYILWLLAVLFMASCEDLEDTYDEFAGDGKIRYVVTLNLAGKGNS